MTKPQMTQPADWQERQKAVDISISCIVQAPAGSGKTELLVQRILALLAVAEAPEEVLSITFTRKAAGEMKLRLLQALERASQEHSPAEGYAAETWQRARSVLARDREQGWGLLQNPNRLQLTTIDSFCALLTRRMPWMARLGDQPKVIDDPSELYQRAAESLLSRLDRGGAGQSAVESLLVHLDNRMTLLRELIVDMLGRRDQWLRHLITGRGKEQRELLESGLHLYVTSFLRQVRDEVGCGACCELVELLRFAAGNLEKDHPFGTALLEKEPLDSLGFWLAVAQLVLTATGDVRKSVTKANGFPADKTPHVQGMKSRIMTLLEGFKDSPAAESLKHVRRLPATCYEPAQWQILKALIELLPLAVIELKEVFRVQGQVDFVEIAGSANAALGSVSEPEDLLLQLDSRLRHILVDEFQDTSFAQYDLLNRLTSGWEPGDGRTLFVVGDPMQSIYRFREAEVGLYLRVCQRGFNGLPMERIVLNTNFRSRINLVDWVNENFINLFPSTEDELRGAVRFAPAIAFDGVKEGPAVTVHGFVDRQDDAEARRVVALVKQTRAINPERTIAILVRSRNHLAAIVKALKQNGLRYQAQDVDPLIDRPAVQDILSLTRAIQHLADRVAWLAVLRAPWCGVTLDDLAKLCGNDARSTVWHLLTQPVEQIEMFEQLSADGKQRIDKLVPILERALKNRGRLSLRRLVESTWLSLNGPACVGASDLVDVRQVFALLDDFDMDGSLDVLEKQLGKLFAAPDPQAGPELQLMTIHKAKGLEFDTVILPGLGRGIRSRERALLRWLEHPDYGLLLAPLPPISDAQQDPTYQAIGHILQEKDDLETLRLLYVAVTRAKSQLHLLGHAKNNRDDQLTPAGGSLLSVLWPACSPEFTQNICAVDEEKDEVLPDFSLLRLPVQWQPPPIEQRLGVMERTARLASAGGHYIAETVETRLIEEGRIVGVVVHAWLERIALDGINKWPVTALKQQADNLRLQLSTEGVPFARLDHCVSTVLGCLVRTVESWRGRWLLDTYESAACELAVNGIVEGGLVHAVIDRTFIDGDGVRWVVDYKTSSPESGGDSDAFMQKELERYLGQLQLYVALVGQLSPVQEIRAALYFPAFSGWIEAKL